MWKKTIYINNHNPDFLRTLILEHMPKISRIPLLKEKGMKRMKKKKKKKKRVREV